ncbi:MAG: hypothetical protein SOZ27_03220 [Spirochaetia bacterium]|nr:hypothetical protein [Spirochaetia bacterium]
MNQDRIKELLIKVREPREEFSVIMTGKASKKVNGFYRYDERTIYLHNKNFKSDSDMIYTAIHEYTHHLQICENPQLSASGARCHSRSFWALFHTLLDEAESKGVYTPLYRTDSELTAMAERLKNKYLKDNAAFMLEFGRELTKAYTLCTEKGVRFEDFADRCLGLPRTEAKTLIAVSSVPGTDPSLGWENLKTLTRIRDEEMLHQAEAAFREGKSSDFVKEEFLTKPARKVQTEEERLLEEKKRLERTISSLEKRLEEINRRLEN